jgi:hypothetical protein
MGVSWCIHNSVLRLSHAVKPVRSILAPKNQKNAALRSRFPRYAGCLQNLARAKLKLQHVADAEAWQGYPDRPTGGCEAVLRSSAGIGIMVGEIWKSWLKE